MPNRSVFLLFLLLSWAQAPAFADGQWTGEEVHPPIPLGQGVWEATKKVVGPTEAEMKLVFMDGRRSTLRVVDQDSRRDPEDLGKAMRRAHALAGTNGGYFSPEFEPFGLQVASGQRTGHFERASLLTGLVVVRNGRPALVWRDEFKDLPGITDALQAGPRLVNGGHIIKGLDNTKRRPRTFLLSDRQGHMALGTCRSVTLAELAGILASPDVIRELTVDRALNLDGGNSTGLWWHAVRDGEHYEKEVSTVRNFLAIVPQ